MEVRLSSLDLLSPHVLSNPDHTHLIEATTTAATTTSSATTTQAPGTTLAPGACTYGGETIGPFNRGTVSRYAGFGSCCEDDDCSNSKLCVYCNWRFLYYILLLPFSFV